MVDLEEIDHLALDLFAQARLLRGGGASVPHRAERAGAQAVVAAELDVVEDGQAAEERDVLEGAREAEGGARVRRDAADVGAVEADRRRAPGGRSPRWR